jgi:hypothetical protein
MIGPGVGPSFYSGVPLPFPGATFGSDFTASQYQLNGAVYSSPTSLPGWTFTRASTGYAETAAGALVAFASGAPRITDKGLLVEEARTNLLLRSQEFSTSWNKTGVTITDNDTAAPDGTLTADRVTSTGSVVLSQVAVLSATACAYSVYAKQGSGPTAANTFLLRNNTTLANLLFGTINYSTGVWTGSAGVTVTALANGWWRITMVATTGITSGDSMAVYAAFTGNPTSGEYAYLWGAQLEVGAFPTSYIPTTTASATRADDVPSITSLGTLLGADFTLYAEAEYDTSYPGAGEALTFVVGATINDRLGLYRTTSANMVLQSVIAGVSTAVTLVGVLAGDNLVKGAIASFAASSRASVKGSAITAATANRPTLDRLLPGLLYSTPSTPLNGYVRKLIIYPRAFSDAELQAATT